MQTQQYHFKNVALLITHYNRSKSLERLLHSFNQLNCSFEQVVVSDDGSKPEHLQYIQTIANKFSFQLVGTPINKGLGSNINKGQDAINTKYTLYVQEDFVPTSIFPSKLLRALAIIEENPDFDIIKFYAYFQYPYLKPFDNDFSEMVFRPEPWHTNHLKFYFYSDHPHLRHSNFFNKFGHYVEGEKGDITEYKMSLSFIRQKARGLFYDHFTELFDQKNSADEPSVMRTESWRYNKKPITLLLRWVYLRIKFIRWTLDLIFKKL